MEEYRLLTINEVADYLRLTRDGFNVLRRRDSNFPKPMDLGRRKLWRKSEIDEYLESTRKKEGE